MSLIARIPTNPQGSRVRYPVKRFSAPFALGQYDFNQAGNTDVLLFGLDPASVYVMERINFYANVAESDWLESMDTEANFPAFRVHFRFNESASLFPEPVRCVNYIDNGEQLSFFRTSRKDEQLLITFTGIVNQVPGTVGVATLLAEVNLTIYQIVDQNWINEFIRAEGR